MAAFLMGDTATARSHLAAALAPGSVWTDTVQPRKTLLAGRLALAWCYLAVDSVPAALEQCHLVLGETERGGNAYRPLLGRAYIAEGVCQSRQGDYQSATEAFGRARKVGMQDSPTEILWGRTILSTLKLHDSMEVRRRVVNDALRHFRLAVALDPSSITAHLTLARTLGLLPLDNTVPGWPKEEACAEFRKVLNLDHGNQEAIEGLIRARCW